MKRCIIVCSLVLVFTLLLASCAADMGDSAPAAPAPAPDFAPGDIFDYAPEPAPPPAPAPGAPSPSDWAADSGSSVPLPILTPSDSRGRQMIYSVVMQLQTTDFREGDRLLKNTISDMGGFIVNSQYHGRDIRTPEVERSAIYTLRLPTDRLAEFIVIMEDNNNLYSLWQASDDVTVSHSHGGLTLSDLREQEARLRNALYDLDPEASDSDRLELERALTDVQSDIRSIEAQLSMMEDDVLYSTITVHLFEVIFVEHEDFVELTFGERFSQQASRSWDGFVAFCQGFLIVLIRILPTLLILGVITAATVLIVRVCLKRSKAKIAQRAATRPANSTGYQNWSNHALWSEHYPNAPNNISSNENKTNGSNGNGAQSQ